MGLPVAGAGWESVGVQAVPEAGFGKEDEEIGGPSGSWVVRRKKRPRGEWVEKWTCGKHQRDDGRPDDEH